MPDRGAGPQPSGPIATFVMGSFLLILSALFVHLLIAVWPCACPPDRVACCPGATFLNRWSVPLDHEARLLWIVVFSALLGGFVHVATSFATFVGNRTFSRSWIWWYVLRAPIGVALALILYFVVRGGLFASTTNAGALNAYGIAALAGLAGMFSKQATDKLQEVFDNLFRTVCQGDARRKDKLTKEAECEADERSRASSG